jgi:monovalent cation:H+ antiporter-2, CPA2 family
VTVPQPSGEPASAGESPRHRAVVVGYGPVGRTLARLLRENQVEPVIIELNLDTVRRLGRQGIRALYGDASHQDTLKRSGLEDAVALILSSSTTDRGAEAIRLARDLNPKILIFARSNYLGELPDLREAGADFVFSGEGEVALAMTEFLLRRLRATPEQIDRERARIRSELFWGSPDDRSSPGDWPWARDGLERRPSPVKGPAAREAGDDDGRTIPREGPWP